MKEVLHSIKINSTLLTKEILVITKNQNIPEEYICKFVLLGPLQEVDRSISECRDVPTNVFLCLRQLPNIVRIQERGLPSVCVNDHSFCSPQRKEGMYGILENITTEICDCTVRLKYVIKRTFRVNLFFQIIFFAAGIFLKVMSRDLGE